MSTPVHDWVKPRLDALVAEGVKNGMDREVLVAVLTDIVEGSGYNLAETTEADQLQPDGRTDPRQEPVSTGTLPVTREEWFPYSVSTLPDPE
ncbi:hypothetical protein ACELLULO517_08785 [Acidisoma cellulosilytica]|uniref:Uncharacterized protein n=1 Tax=Acidisoma cellulosilyticum TaxID=2802395 RepID=A0A963Z090_9PROT|nr:hypothetical protein [Acidisoma cellulosilyticum]MCB8880326.1 hypothetical protein [Acidisoma cellulosilyticum]